MTTRFLLRQQLQALKATRSTSAPFTRTFCSSSASTVNREASIKFHGLENEFPSKTSAVQMRRQNVESADKLNGSAVHEIPYIGSDFDQDSFYDSVYGTNCENVVGFIPLPVGVAGPLRINNQDFIVPLATTEGALIASINRGTNAILQSGGCRSFVLKDEMTRAPVVALDSLQEAVRFGDYVNSPEGFQKMKEQFESTTNFGKLLSVNAVVTGRLVYLRFSASTGDAMGMNMIGKGVNQVFLSDIFQSFQSLKLISLSSNLCTDKKPSAVNWIHGRGKTVVSEVKIPEDVLKKVLKVSIPEILEMHKAKNYIGSSLAGSIGGNNAHASNIVTALFLATGQDPAQNVESSNCLLQLDSVEEDGKKFLLASVTMPSVEVGTVGGGTSLSSQKACLKLLGVQGASRESPGQNARNLSEVVAATVLAGELSLNAALSSNHLISAHMELNRK